MEVLLTTERLEQTEEQLVEDYVKLESPSCQPTMPPMTEEVGTTKE
jgi:hypothetical protein